MTGNYQVSLPLLSTICPPSNENIYHLYANLYHRQTPKGLNLHPLFRTPHHFLPPGYLWSSSLDQILSVPCRK
ncbi:hypothetical protein AMECASPLE_008599 [Ameca splendens]|uniref:Uncharacterized protein n=1 Tax=Ameca splendens TaxID=208324 RepID=A0ABV0ZJP5_9TELE